MNEPSMADVSVVIPCFNCAETIATTVDSVHRQTLRPREVILVDDCSSDDTGTTLINLQHQYPDGWLIVLTSARNGGAGEARNLGWQAASCGYVAFLDADESWHPRKVEQQYKWMLAHPEVTLTGHPKRHLKTGIAEIAAGDMTQDIDFVPVTRKSLLLSNCFATSSVMLRSDVIHRFKQGKRYSEDYLLWLHIACDGARLYRTAEHLAFCYKSHFGEGGLSAQLEKMQRGELDNYREIRDRGCIGRLQYLLLVSWSWMRHISRHIKVMIRTTTTG